jgi:hypothetical protein
MSAVYLLTQGVENTFAFEHAMGHRNYFGAMHPLTRFSVLPYLLDPPHGTDISGGPWNLNHQQAHNDAHSALPAQYGIPSDLSLNLFIGQNLRDTSSKNPDQLKWWTFANHMEHYVANNTILPGPVAPPPTVPGFPAGYRTLWVFPFW